MRHARCGNTSLAPRCSVLPLDVGLAKFARSDADAVIAQLPGWFEDYNRVAPHSSLGWLSHLEFRVQESLNQRV